MRRMRLILRWIAWQPRRAVLLTTTAAVTLAAALLLTWIATAVAATLASLVTTTETGDARLVLTDGGTETTTVAPVRRGAVAGRVLTTAEVADLTRALAPLGVSVSPRLAVAARLLPSGVPVELVGVDPSAETAVLPGLAGLEPLSAGGWVTVAGPDVAYAEVVVASLGSEPPALIRLPVQRITTLSSGNVMVDSYRVYLWREALAEALAAPGSAATEVALRFRTEEDPFNRAYEVQQTLAEQFQSAVVQPWPELVPEIAYIAGSASGRLVRAVLFVLAAVIVGTATTLHVTTRATELATLRTLGMTDGELVGLFAAETALLSAAGSAAGAVLAAAGAALLRATTLRIPRILLRLAPRLRLSDPIEVVPGSIVGPAVTLVAAAVAVAYLALRRRIRGPISPELRRRPL